MLGGGGKRLKDMAGNARFRKDVADLGVCEGCGAALGLGVMGLLRSVIESVHLRSAQLHVITKFSRRSAQIMTPICIWDNIHLL